MKVSLRKLKLRNVGESIHKLAGALESIDGADLYDRLTGHWQPADVVVDWAGANRLPPKDVLSLPTLAEQMMALDGVTYLPDDILAKIDRASMSSSLETRVPFLDHRVVEFAWRLPLSMKIRGGERKWILRRLLHKYISRDLVDRPKMGFGVPISSWLQGPLRHWAEALLDESRLKREGYFIAAPIRRKWKEHLSGKRNWQYHLWDVLMFQAWLETQIHAGAQHA
jgi:asparagine synthase (glutamine-hydrolysing)